MIQLRGDDLSWQEIDDEIVVLDLRTSRYFAINGSGAHLWRMLTEPRTADELATALADRYDVSHEAAQRDVTAFVRDLDDRALIVR